MDSPNSTQARPRAAQLLVKLLNPKTGRAAVESNALSEPEWDALVAIALKQGVAPMLYRRLQETGAQIPPRLLQTLADEYRGTALRNMQLFQELCRVVRALEQANIAPVVLKGAHIAQVAYGNAALRPMNDLDVLVARADLERAEVIVQRLGYEPHPEVPERAWALANHYHFCYYLPTQDPMLELHWHIESPRSPFRVNLPALIERAPKISLAGLRVRVLSPADLVLHLCLQISYHHLFDFAALRTCFDLAYVIAAYANELDWKLVQRRAVEWRARRSAYLALELAREIAGAAAPEDAMRALMPRDFDPRFVVWALDRMLTAPQELDAPLRDAVSDGFGNVWRAPSLRGKFAALLATTFPSRQTMARLYQIPPDSKKIYLRYPRRWQTLARRHAPRVWQLAQRDEKTRAWMEREGKRTALMDWITTADA